MKRVYTKRKTKKAMTLAETIVAMALTALFATSAIMLILPVEQIYTSSTDISRAQIIADTVVDSLRQECASTYIEGLGDVWIGDEGNHILDAANPQGEGKVLIIRKNAEYCETIYANSTVDTAVYNQFFNDSALQNAEIKSRAIYSLFSAGNEHELESGYVHFGYYKLSGGNSEKVIPAEYYDFTNPFPYATYRDYTVELNFSDLTFKDNQYPAYVTCRIDIKRGSETVYSRNAVLCFAAKAQ